MKREESLKNIILNSCLESFLSSCGLHKTYTAFLLIAKIGGGVNSFCNFLSS